MSPAPSCRAHAAQSHDSRARNRAAVPYAAGGERYRGHRCLRSAGLPRRQQSRQLTSMPVFGVLALPRRRRQARGSFQPGRQPGNGRQVPRAFGCGLCAIFQRTTACRRERPRRAVSGGHLSRWRRHRRRQFGGCNYPKPHAEAGPSRPTRPLAAAAQPAAVAAAALAAAVRPTRRRWRRRRRRRPCRPASAPPSSPGLPPRRRRRTAAVAAVGAAVSARRGAAAAASPRRRPARRRPARRPSRPGWGRERCRDDAAAHAALARRATRRAAAALAAAALAAEPAV